jgi:hypothetical protein
MRLAAWRFGIVAAVLLLVPGLGMAQENKNKPADMPPADDPGVVHKQMASLAGSWDVAVTYVIEGKEHKGTAKCEAKWILDGRFLQQDYKSTLQGKPFAVLQLLGYDNQKKKTIEIMMDNLSTGMLHNEGSIDGDGKVITNEGEMSDRAAGKVVNLRTVTTIIDPDHYTLEWFNSGKDGAFEKTVSMLHTRRKP